MNFIFLSPHFPPPWYLFCTQLKRRGVRVLGIADQPWASLRPELQEALTDYRQVYDMNDYPALLRACASLSQKYGKIDRVESHIEHWLEAQARLRTDLGIPGIKLDRIEDIKRKSHMKRIFQGAGLPTAPGIVARTLEQALGFVAQVGYPVVVKPDIGVGASATYKLRDEQQLRQFFASHQAVDSLVEKFLVGPIYTFDGLVDREGRIVFFGSLTYSQGIMETVNEDQHLYYYTLPEIPPDLEEFGRRTVAAFDVRESFFHFEYFRTSQDGKLVALEVNMRPPGGPTVDMYNYSCDIDLYSAWAEIITRGTCHLPYERKYVCGYIGRKFNKSYAHSHEEVLRRLQPRLVHHLKMEPVFARAMSDYAYIVRSPSLETVLSDAAFAQRA